MEKQPKLKASFI